MRRILVIAFALSLLCGVSFGDIPKVYVGTFTMANTFFKPNGFDKAVGGGYMVSANGEGYGHIGLDFNTKADFALTDNQYVAVKTGVESSVNGATYYGISTGLSELTPTANGYRGKDFKVHFYTITPETSIINEIATGFLANNEGSADINHQVKIGDKLYDMGTKATLDNNNVKQESTIDPNAPQGFGQNYGYDLNNFEYDDSGMYFIGSISTDSTTLIS